MFSYAVCNIEYVCNIAVYVCVCVCVCDQMREPLTHVLIFQQQHDYLHRDKICINSTGVVPHSKAGGVNLVIATYLGQFCKLAKVGNNDQVPGN